MLVHWRSQNRRNVCTIKQFKLFHTQLSQSVMSPCGSFSQATFIVGYSTFIIQLLYQCWKLKRENVLYITAYQSPLSNLCVLADHFEPFWPKVCHRSTMHYANICLSFPLSLKRIGPFDTWWDIDWFIFSLFLQSTHQDPCLPGACRKRKDYFLHCKIETSQWWSLADLGCRRPFYGRYQSRFV